MLEIRGLKKTYAGGVQALKGIDLEVSAGVFGLLGPNGAGKTTLMKILATLLEPDSGEVGVNGVDFIGQKMAARRMLGYLPQEFGLYPTLTAEQTLDYFARLHSRLHGETESAGPSRTLQGGGTASSERAALPRVNLLTRGRHASFEQFKAASGVEFRLLRAERGLVVVAPLVVFMCGLELAGYKGAPGVSYSAGYAASAANVPLLFLFGIALFYAGEAIHRDRELRVEPLLWSAPVPNFVLLLSKFSATLLLASGLAALVTLTAVGLQIYKGHAPLELQTYLAAYALILVPTEVFMIAASVALNVLLRDKYLTYALSLAVVGGIYYLISQGYNHPLYNPALYRLWAPSDSANGGGHLTRILIQRIYCLALSAFLLALAHLFSERRPEKGLRTQGRLSGRGWALIVALASALTAVVTGLMVGRAAWPPAAQF